MAYKIVARYTRNEEFGDWQVGAFNSQEEAEAYCVRTMGQYRNEYGEAEFQMKTVAISAEEARKWIHFLNTMLD